MYTLIFVVTLLANQPYGMPAKYLETIAVASDTTEAGCKRLIAHSVSWYSRDYVEKGKYVSIEYSCIANPK